MALAAHLRRLLPRTLLVRAFLLLALLLLVSVSIWVGLFRVAEREPRARQLAQLTASVVNITRAALLSSDPVLRRDLLRDLSEREGLRLYPAEEQDRATPLPDKDFLNIFQREARELMGPDARFASVVNEQPGFWIRFSMEEGDDYWLVLPRERTERNPAWQWLGWGALSLVLSLVVAWLIVARIARPLKTMADAAGAVGRGERPQALAEDGAEEIRLLARAMNQMSADLSRLENDRAQVLAGISHDLRTPLARLRLAAEMGVEDDSLRSGIQEDISQMDGIIGQFLDFARGEDQEPETLADPNLLLEALARRYRERGLEVSLETTPLPPLPLRPRALERALVNLLDNAVKYGAAPLTLASRQVGGRIELAVLDRGCGIPEAEMERLKQPFTQLEAARSDTTGTGLGLAIVERIARLHGGHLKLRNRPGGGLESMLDLPAPHGDS
ncbi:two-component sensor histidine kinase [Azospira sp. I13]|uniref:ATP-binding protein n=1 Tax=Azospira sp. I13 TaxID=1765050 RepID=UPI000D3FFA78|nr:ATP-binding protein [Azospira sp. I13]GBG03875.1 two-component sensor histidine kinase [Azospira sp. I13]